MPKQNVQETRINIRVDKELKQQADDIFKKLGLNISDGVNIFLRRVVADNGIPFSMTLTRAEVIGLEAAELEAAFNAEIQRSIAEKQENGLPVARYDEISGCPFLEYPDGRRDYDFGA